MILVSACLLGENCKYSGGNNENAAVRRWLQGREYLAVCPELLGGLAAPRPPAERQGERIVNAQGGDDTAAFLAGAQKTLELCQQHNIRAALLKEGSPSCGVHQIYDGSFCHRRIPRQGVTAELLAAHGVALLSEEDLV